MSAERCVRQGDELHATRVLDAEQFAKARLGFAEIKALEDFPIGLCAVGFTRVKSDPSQTILVPFPAIGRKTPLFSVVTATEAIYIQLDPVRVLTWLQNNHIMAGLPAQTRSEAWSVLYRQIPGLGASKIQPGYNQPAASAVRTLLHTISHVLLRHIEWSGYAAQSVGEYLIPEGLACVLYASRYTDTKVGGLLTLFEQRIGEWLRESLQEGSDCVLDPFCAEEGGACVGCLHREFNCSAFNRELSRATLYGGPVPQYGLAALPFGSISHGYWSTDT